MTRYTPFETRVFCRAMAALHAMTPGDIFLRGDAASRFVRDVRPDIGRVASLSHHLSRTAGDYYNAGPYLDRDISEAKKALAKAIAEIDASALDKQALIDPCDFGGEWPGYRWWLPPPEPCFSPHRLLGLARDFLTGKSDRAETLRNMAGFDIDFLPTHAYDIPIHARYAIGPRPVSSHGEAAGYISGYLREAMRDIQIFLPEDYEIFPIFSPRADAEDLCWGPRKKINLFFIFFLTPFFSHA